VYAVAGFVPLYPLPCCRLSGTGAPQPVSPATFAGTWVGLKQVANNTLTRRTEAQTVTLTIEVVDGKLVGTLTPFLAATTAPRSSTTEIVGEELRASAIVGKPPRCRRRRGKRAGSSWKSDTRIRFTLKADRTRMKGAADVELSGVKWMQYNYDLEKKRSRY
jgi:hypothetical protein